MKERADYNGGFFLNVYNTQRLESKPPLNLNVFYTDFMRQNKKKFYITVSKLKEILG